MSPVLPTETFWQPKLRSAMPFEQLLLSPLFFFSLHFPILRLFLLLHRMGNPKKRAQARKRHIIKRILFPLFVEGFGRRGGLRPKPRRHNSWKRKTGGPPSPRAQSVHIFTSIWTASLKKKESSKLPILTKNRTQKKRIGESCTPQDLVLFNPFGSFDITSKRLTQSRVWFSLPSNSIFMHYTHSKADRKRVNAIKCLHVFIFAFGAQSEYRLAAQCHRNPRHKKLGCCVTNKLWLPLGGNLASYRTSYATLKSKRDVSNSRLCPIVSIRPDKTIEKCLKWAR